MPKKAVMFLVKLAVTVGLFVLLFWPEKFGLAPDVFGGIKPGDLWREIQAANGHDIAFWLSFALIVKLAGIFCNMLRWRLLLKGQGLNIPFPYLVQSFFVGRTIGIFLPGTIGLDGYRLYDSSMYTGEVIKCTTVIVVEKLTGLIALTALVFLTFPLGFRLFNINIPTLAVMLGIAGSVVVVLFLLLLNPRIIQILVAVLPTPGFVRSKLNKLGAAATAYSGNRLNLILAVFFGLLGHAGTCFMYFGTMSAISAKNTGLLDILFAAPLMIGATVIGPSVGGEGIREIVFVTMLAASTTAVAAATLAHLGWWVGEVVPFLIGLPIYLVRKRPPREEIEARLATAREEAVGPAADYLHLPAEVVGIYARRIYGCIAAGITGGLLAGGLVGLAECMWHHHLLTGLTEMQMFTWAPVVYGLCFAGVGLGVAGALLLLYLLFDRFASWRVSYVLSFAGTLGITGLLISIFQYNRDIMHGDGIPMDKKIMVLAFVAGITIVAGVLLYVLAIIAGKVLRDKPMGLIPLGIAAWVVCIVLGTQLGRAYEPGHDQATFTPAAKSDGPNILFIGVDTLRADYLPLFNPEAKAKTPALEAFAKDAVLFEKAFSQASWTKPSFATMFTGLYPESHTATTKTAMLPDEVETFAELLQAGGYYTQGFSNNPNTDTLFNFDQGFVNYTDLKPNHLFGAELSSSKLFMYNTLRLAKEQFSQRIGMKLARLPLIGMPLFRGLVQFDVTEHYQPAEVVTRVGLDWVDKKMAPKGTPFLLFLHYMDPHDPFMDPNYIEGGYARSRMAHPDPDKFEEPMRNAYISDIEHFDQYLGALFDGLKSRGLYDDTLIILTGDHGEEFFEHQGWWHGQTLYDEMTHVPLIIKLPGNAHGGARNPDLARHVDLAPTMLHFAGLKKGAHMPGQTLYDKVGDTFTNASIGYAYAEVHFEGQDLQAVRSPDCKLIHANANNPRGLPAVELFDLANDPKEQKNLAGQGTLVECEQDLGRRMEEYQEVIRENAAEPTTEAPISDELTEQLESLGYIE